VRSGVGLGPHQPELQGLIDDCLLPRGAFFGHGSKRMEGSGKQAAKLAIGQNRLKGVSGQMLQLAPEMQLP